MKENQSRTILLSGTFLSYELRKNKRAKRTNLTIYPSGRLVVTIPYFATHLAAERLLRFKKDWVLRNLSKVLKRDVKILPQINKRELEIHRNKARNLIEKEIERINEFYNFSYKKIFIKNHTSQWGSCSSLGNLNFNIRLILLPDNLIEYVIVHELCHLKEQNHSKDFWNLVGQFVKDYKKCNRELGEYVIS